MSISSGIGSLAYKPGVCTSASRPASPYAGQVIYQTDTNQAFVWNGSAWVLLSTGTANPPGMEYITGTTFTGQTTAFIDNVFNATYENYLITMETTDTSATGSWQFRLRAGGTPAASGNYYYGGFQYYTNANATNANGSNANEIVFSASTSSASTYSIMQINDPFVAKTTSMIFDYVSGYSNYSGGSVRGQHALATSYDGFQINMNTGGAITGNFRVYGMRKP